MKNEEVVHSVAGSASCLVYGANRTIIGFDWENRTFSWLTLQKVLDKFSVTQEQFVDMCLLSGSSILPTMPEIDNDGPIPRMAAAKSVMKRANMDGHTACLQANDAEYLSLFRKARFAVKHMVVVKSDGAIEPLDKDNAPSDTHDFIGQRLPDELSAYHARGLAGGRVLTWRTRQEIFETPPLDGGSSQAYRDLIQEKLLPLRARSLAIVTPSLHRYYHKHEVGLVCWFNEGEERKLGLTDMALTDVTKDAETWHVKDEMMSESADAHQLHESPLQYAVALLSDNKLAKKTVTRRPIGDHSLLQTPSELLANTVWRFLQDRGYLNSDHTLSAWGQALKIAFVQARKDHYLTETYPTGEAEESIFLAFELLRLDILNSRQMFPTPPYSGAPLRGTEADKAHTLLISRVACLGTFKHDTIGYTGPLSRHLLAYHQMVAAVRNSLRDIAEMHACNMLLSGSALRLRDLKQYGDLGARLPFAREPDLGLALVVKSYLDELSNDTNRRADIKRWFNHALDIDGDLQKAWKMWGAVSYLADECQVAEYNANSFPHSRSTRVYKPQTAPSSALKQKLCSKTPIRGFSRSVRLRPSPTAPTAQMVQTIRPSHPSFETLLSLPPRREDDQRQGHPCISAIDMVCLN